jgi:hypothetical protein
MQRVPLWLHIVVRVDFVLAVLLTVIAPLALLSRAALSKQPEQLRTLIGYWRASSLLMVTVYLLNGQRRTAYATGVVARLLIPWSLRTNPTNHDPLFAAWRSAVIGYCLVGAGLNAPMLPSLVSRTPSLVAQAYVKPAQEFGNLLHPGIAKHTLGRVGEIGLLAYILGAIIVLKYGW